MVPGATIVRRPNNFQTEVGYSLNPIRDQGSLAHPNEALLDEPEATLVINTVRTLMIYLEGKLSI